jgi:hypothetical protein
VFAILDGKQHTEVFGLVNLFAKHFDELKKKSRMSSDYFDIRFYANAGTFHIFPRRKDLIDRLNRFVGKHRQWLPVDDTEAVPEFWEQYDKAEAVKKQMEVENIDMWYLHNGEESYQDREHQKLLEAHTKALDVVGIEFDASRMLRHQPHHEPVQLLLEAS